jgi:hypothetical protein
MLYKPYLQGMFVNFVFAYYVHAAEFNAPPNSNNEDQGELDEFRD